MALVGRETGAIEIRAMEEGGVRKKVRGACWAQAIVGGWIPGGFGEQATTGSNQARWPPGGGGWQRSALLRLVCHQNKSLSGRHQGVDRLAETDWSNTPPRPTSLNHPLRTQTQMTVETNTQARGAHLGWSLSLHATESRKGPKGTNVTVKKTILDGVSKWRSRARASTRSLVSHRLPPLKWRICGFD
jgi:hypothetical protein